MSTVVTRVVGQGLTAMLLPAFIILAGPLLAQQSKSNGADPAKSSIRGVVTAIGPQGETTSLEGVSVKLSGASPGEESLSTLTDAEGEYRFEQLGPGTYMLETRVEGLKPFVKTVVLEQHEARVENVGLELETVVQRVEVRDQAPAISTQGSAPAATLTDHQFVALPLAEQKFKEALPLVPGVIRTPDGKLNIKGAVENQGMLLVDSAQTVDPVTGSLAIGIPIDAIRTLNVYKTPYSAQYGGFSGGLTTIETKPPSGQWNYGLMDFIPGLRGKSGHIVGISDDTPRLFLGGPILKDRLNFSEAFSYEVKKRPVRGLPWPNNETKTQGFNSLTSFQAIVSPRHLLTANVNVFPTRTQFADINSLVPQTASSDYGQKGVAIGAVDSHQLSSGALLSTVFRYTRFDANAHGQGPADMLITPDGWGGNFFNAWTRNTNQFEALPIFQFPSKKWHGRHEVKAGVDFTHRSYTENTLSHAIQLLREDGSLAERIDFQGGGSLEGKDTEVSEFVQDHWMLNGRLALDLGGRLSTQSMGRSAAFAPRVALAYSPGEDRKTIIRAGAGLFYDRVPLLATDFTQNPTRVVSFDDGSGRIVGAPVVLWNTYVRTTRGVGVILGGRDLDTSPRNLTWNFEVDRQVWRSVMLRLGYVYSQTQELYVVDPLIGAFGQNSVLGLTNTGRSHYHELETTVHFRPSERSELNVSYVRSRARGDLNTLANIFVPFELPVIRPNVTGNLPSDVPNRLVSWGVFQMPWNLTLSPVVDLHTGFPYSKVDALQNYVGTPNSERFPTFFSLDLKVYREFQLPLPMVGRMKNHKFRLGIYSLNATNHSNPRDVFNNVTSPFFGHFVGFQHRVNGFVLDVVD